MKRIISFEKKLEFPSMVGEITSISLEHTLNFVSPSTIEGAFLVSGTYKLTEASCIEDNFNYKIPTEIMLNEKIDTSTSKIEIDDFYYEIENDENLICYIDVLVEGVEEIEIEEIENNELNFEEVVESEIKNEEVLSRECDGDLYQNEQEEQDINYSTNEEIKEDDMVLENKIDNIQEKEPETMTEAQPVKSLFSSLRDDDDTFATYSIYILRQDETLQTIIEKYKTTKEELEDYNDLSNVTIGSKIIIPLHDK